MAQAISRRQLFSGDFGNQHQPVRPPWAITEADFINTCSRCDECIRACTQNIIRRGDGGYPEINFTTAGCTFCGDCVTVCSTSALTITTAQQSPWTYRAFLQQGCFAERGIVCRSCGEVCENRAINFQLKTGGRVEVNINESVCNGCGECVSICPADVINVRSHYAESKR